MILCSWYFVLGDKVEQLLQSLADRVVKADADEDDPLCAYLLQTPSCVASLRRKAGTKSPRCRLLSHGREVGTRDHLTTDRIFECKFKDSTDVGISCGLDRIDERLPLFLI